MKQVKSTEKAPYEPDKATMPAWTFMNEWASLKFLENTLAGSVVAPRLYGADRASGLMVIEDLGYGLRLDQLLLGSDPGAAESALLKFVSIHGRMHASSIGRQHAFRALREPLGPTVLDDGYYSYSWLEPTFYQTLELLGITAEPGVEHELAALRDSLLQPGPFTAFIQVDACPDNCLFIDAEPYLIDLEGGRFDHALKVGTYARMRFPTCWCVFQLPEQIVERMEQAYRAELSKGCVEARDDTLFQRAVTEACVYWMLDWFKLVPLAKILEKDRLITAATDRQRYLMRSEVVAKAAQEFGHMPAIGATMHAIAKKMRALWPDVEEVPYYPAFR